MVKNASGTEYKEG